MRQYGHTDTVNALDPRATSRRWSPQKAATAALLVAAGYYAGALAGFALTFDGRAVAALWPPNAIVLAALLIAPVSSWWVVLLAVLPAHFAIQAANGVPLPMIACWYVSNCSEALIGAIGMRRVLPRPIRLDSVRAVATFAAFGVFLGPFLSSFLDAAFVVMNGWGTDGYWAVWKMRFLPNVIASVTIVPVILGINRATLDRVRRASWQRVLEVSGLAIGVLATSILAFLLPEPIWRIDAVLLFAPLPVLFWAAVRFGTVEVSLCMATVVFLATWGAVHGNGALAGQSKEASALSIQLLLLLVSLPLIALGALIAERRRAMETLRDSQRILALTIGAARIGIWGMDLETAAVTSNDALLALMGVKPTQALKRDEWLRLIHPADIERVLDNQRQALADDAPRDSRGDTPIPELEYRAIHPDGTVRWHLSRGAVLRRDDGRAYSMAGTAIDITSSKRAEERQREHDERLSLAAAAAHIGFWSCEFDTGSVWTTDECRTITGLPPETELSIDTLRDLLHPEDVLRVLSTFRPNARSEAAVDLELRVVRPDGDVRTVMLTARTERDAAGADVRLIGVAMDVTERHRAKREADEQRREVAHLARVVTLGEMSGALAHELGQPLAAIMSNTQAALRLMERAHLDRAMLRGILQDIVSDDRRAADVIGRVRRLLKKDNSQRERVSPIEIVQEALELARSELIENKVSVRTAYEPDLTAVVVDRIQMQQVLLNLILNGRDAMSQTPATERRLAIEVTTAASGQIRISVSDSGPGIATDQLGLIFERFYTTKANGLGLGLPICRSIVSEHGGDLWAENGERGARFVMLLRTPGAESDSTPFTERAVQAPATRMADFARRELRTSPAAGATKYSQDAPGSPT